MKGSTALRFMPTYEQWLLDIQNHTRFDDYWRQRGYGPLPHVEQHADVPILWIGGWYDTYTRGTTENVAAFRRAKRSPQHLLIGPWLHCSDGSPVAGQLDFGPEAVIDSVDLHLRWFDRWLRDVDNGIDLQPATRLFITGANRWQDSNAWPPEHCDGRPLETVTWHLGPDLTLSREPIAREAAYPFPFDADNPVPTHGGQLSAGGDLLLPGAMDQNRPPIAGRSDILRFRSEPLADDLAILGPLTVTLQVRASLPTADLSVKLIEELPGGPAWNLTDSICRAEGLSPDTPTEITVTCFPIGHVFRAGHRVRLDIAASNFPRFDLNPAGSCNLWLDISPRRPCRLTCGEPPGITLSHPEEG